MSGCGRFAPTASGPAHPGTLAAALLCWCDARSRGEAVLLRLEDVDPQRCSPDKAQALIEQLAWFGLSDWDGISWQSQQRQRHQQALEQLAASGALYPCDCSRSTIRSHGQRALDGGWVYPGTCRGRPLGPQDLSPQAAVTLRLHLDEHITLRDESGLDLSMDIPRHMGDPVLRRRDGAMAYHLASVVDDAAAGVTRVVRGRDLAPSTAIQVALHRRLGQAVPSYRHHLLFMEPHGGKQAKFHGAVGVPELRQHYRPEELCGFVAWVLGLLPENTGCRPQDLVANFSWQRLPEADQVLAWDGQRLQWQGAAA